MNFQHLQAFIHVAEAGSFSKAALLLDVAQPVLSRQVRALEVDLRETLFTRTGRGVALTEAGRQLLAHGHAIVQSVDQARQALHGQRSEPLGRVTVGLPPSLARRLTQPLVDGFHREMPRARLAMVEGFSMHISEWLSSGRMDLGLVYTPEPDPDIEIRPVLQERLCLIGPAAALAGMDGVRFADLGRFPLLMPQRGQIFRKLMEAQATLSQVQLDVVWEVSSVPAILDLVRGGYGYAALTDSALRGQGLDASLAEVPIHSPQIISTLCLVQSATKKAPPLVRRTAELLQRLALEVCAVESGRL
ncbi:LysR family transcriptional regulator [Melaminivora sp.]|uniref:LysR family transcriptional regulator n=1 Tax=Melaminivora sp. TaxID=1933032 RepID=UPI0028AA0EFC|nr:LysR family transcriptional regulator [Melaminivora sp.]